MAEITNWVKKIWKNRTTEFPTRRTLMKEDGSSEIVTVTRNEGTVSEEGDAFDADTMNNLEERIDAGFAEVNGKLDIKYKTFVCTIARNSDSPFGYYGRVSKADCGLSDNDKILSVSGYNRDGYPAITSYEASSEELRISSNLPDRASIHILYITL